MFVEDSRSGRGGAGMARRSFLFGAIFVGAGLAWKYFPRSGASASASDADTSAKLPPTVEIVDFSDSGERRGAASVATVVKTENEWRKQLSPDSFEITRHADTERAYTNENPNNHAKGVFRCICCDTALFDAATKFDSGTGWPSFWQPIAKENIVETSDRSLGISRTAVSCRRCAAHLGHVFDDGPRPTGLRYCMNSLAMRFARAS
jgi:peptide-methionine (R)-S-oxide reductase